MKRQLLSTGLLLVLGGHPLQSQRPAVDSSLVFVRVTALRNVELVSLDTGRSQRIYQADSQATVDMQTMSPNRYVAFREQRPSTEPSLVIVDLGGVVVRRVSDGVQRYVWCGGNCLAIIRGPTNETDAHFSAREAIIIQSVVSDSLKAITGPGVPYDLYWAAFDSSLYLKYPTHQGVPAIYRYSITTGTMALTTHGDLHFSPDGRYYLSFGSLPWQRPMLYDARTDSAITTPSLDSLGFPIRWLDGSGAMLLIRKNNPRPPPRRHQPRPKGQPLVFTRPLPGEPADEDYYVYDMAAPATVRLVHGHVLPWSGLGGQVPMMSVGRPFVVAAH